MIITPYGAAGGEVTGSAYVVETKRARILIDCGIFQGGKEADAHNRATAGWQEGKLDAVLITHGHLDHTGRLPLLVKTGFNGPIFATPATIEMAGLILRDSAHVQAQDVERKNRKLARADLPPVTPLYTAPMVEQLLLQFKAAPYRSFFEVAPGIRARFRTVRHRRRTTASRTSTRRISRRISSPRGAASCSARSR